MKTGRLAQFRDRPIGQKLAIAFTLTTSIALLLATAFFAFTTWQHEKENAKAELLAVANLIGANSTAALAFDDTAAAQETLSSLRMVPGIIFAALYDKDGGELARFDRYNSGNRGSTDTPSEASESIDLKITRAIEFDGNIIGTVVLYATLQPRIEQLLDNSLLVIAASLVSFLIALLIAWRIQQSITRPIDELTVTMERVSRNHDYTVRVPIKQNDELGMLANGINEMLSRAQKRDQELEQHRHELESEVSRRTTDLQEANQKLKTELDERTSIEIGLKKAHQELERHHEESSLLSEMNDRLQVCHAVDEIRPIVAHYARKLFPGCSGALYVYNNSRTLIEPVVSWGNPLPADVAFRQDDCWALRQGRLHVVDDPETGLICQHCENDIRGPYICVPMIAYGEVMGVLHLEISTAADSSSTFSASFEQITVSASEHLALALANLRLREVLQAQSVRDPLTGLFNRRYMLETFERELARTHRTDSSLAVIMIDVDHFKLFNDTYGHEAGDLVLHELSSYMLRTIRSDDLACRYGGEEFVVIMPGVDEQDARLRAEELRLGTKTLHLQYKGQSLSGLSISLGVAIAPQNGESVDVLLNVADTALYKAKHAGRDQVIMASNSEQMKKNNTAN